MTPARTHLPTIGGATAEFAAERVPLSVSLPSTAGQLRLAFGSVPPLPVRLHDSPRCRGQTPGQEWHYSQDAARARGLTPKELVGDERGEGRGEGRPLAPRPASAPHPDPL